MCGMFVFLSCALLSRIFFAIVGRPIICYAHADSAAFPVRACMATRMRALALAYVCTFLVVLARACNHTCVFLRVRACDCLRARAFVRLISWIVKPKHKHAVC